MNWKRKMAILSVAVICMATSPRTAAASWHSPATVSYSQFLEKVRAEQVDSVIISSRNTGAVPAICRLKDGTERRTILPADYRDALAAMQEKSVNVEIRTSSGGISELVMSAAPFLLLLGVWIVLLICGFPNGRPPRASWLWPSAR